MNRPDISGIAPFFIVRNVPAALSFYRDSLGFDDPRFAGEMVMTWLLTPAPEGTTVQITAENVPVGISPADLTAARRMPVAFEAAHH